MENKYDVIVETPGGSNLKYDFNMQTGRFELNKLLPSGMVFPFDFGFIPGTIGEDGDPLDVIIISEAPTFTGCSLCCRIIGCIVATQTERDGEQVRNDRYIAVPVISSTFEAVEKLANLPSELIKHLETFFINYNDLAGKKFEIAKKVGVREAQRMIAKAGAEEQPTIKVELLIPLTKTNGESYPKVFFDELKKDLINDFGGLTVYSRSPADGFWEDEQQIAKQAIIVYELLVAQMDLSYWQSLKVKLQQKFNEKEILILHSPIAKITT